MMKYLIIIFIACLHTAFVKGQSALRYTFKVGDAYVIMQTSRQQVKQSLFGTEQVIDNAGSGTLHLVTQKLNADGSATLDAHYTMLAMTMQLPEGISTISFDSEGDTAQVGNRIARAMMHKHFLLTLSPQGKVLVIDGEENLWSDFKNAGLDNQQLQQLQYQFEQNFGEASLRSQFDTFLYLYPLDVKSQSWINITGVEVMGLSLPMSSENKLTMQRKGVNENYIIGDGNITTTDTTRVVMMPNGLKAAVNLAGKQTINARVMAGGWPAQVASEASLAGQVTLKASVITPIDIAMPVDIHTKTDITILKK